MLTSECQLEIDDFAIVRRVFPESTTSSVAAWPCEAVKLAEAAREDPSIRHPQFKRLARHKGVLASNLRDPPVGDPRINVKAPRSANCVPAKQVRKA